MRSTINSWSLQLNKKLFLFFKFLITEINKISHNFDVGQFFASFQSTFAFRLDLRQSKYMHDLIIIFRLTQGSHAPFPLYSGTAPCVIPSIRATVHSVAPWSRPHPAQTLPGSSPAATLMAAGATPAPIPTRQALRGSMASAHPNAGVSCQRAAVRTTWPAALLMTSG
jgi:hypothetical protein